MKVLYVGHTYMIGVNRKKLDELGQMQGVELSVLVPRIWQHYLRWQEVELSEESSYELLPENTTFQGREGVYFYFPDLTMHMLQIKPDIIHVEQGGAAVVYTQALINRSLFAPQAKTVFFTWWNLYDTSPRPLLRWLEKFNLRHSDYAIAGNHDAMKILRQKGFDKPIKVLPQLGVDIELYCPLDVSKLKKELRLDGFVIGYVGRFLKQKGLTTLVEAFAQLEGTCTLVLVGRGNLKETLIELASSLGISAFVRFVDTVPHAEVPHYMNCMDVVVLPSRTMLYWEEQFGHVLIEAMACETPVIGSDSGEIPNVIGDGGLIFREGDADDLACKLQFLMDSPSFRAELAAKGRQRVLAQYTNHRIAEETYQVYQEMLSGG